MDFMRGMHLFCRWSRMMDTWCHSNSTLRFVMEGSMNCLIASSLERLVWRSLLRGTPYSLIYASYEHYGLVARENGITYKEWAPNAKEVYLTGEFNHWDRRQHKFYDHQSLLGALKMHMGIGLYFFQGMLMDHRSSLTIHWLRPTYCTHILKYDIGMPTTNGWIGYQLG